MLTKLKINGVDFTPYLAEGGLTYGWVTRQSREVVTMDAVKHLVTTEKRQLGVRLIPMRDAAYKKLVAALRAVPAEVEYTEEDGSEPSKLFYVLNKSGTAQTVRGGNTYYSGFGLTLEER